MNFGKAGLKLGEKIKNMPTIRKWIAGIVLAAAIAGGVFMMTRGEQSILVDVIEVKQEDLEKNVVSNGRLEASLRQEFFTPVDSTFTG